MPKSDQIDMYESKKQRMERLALDLVRVMREVKDSLGAKEVAYLLGKDSSYGASEVDNALACRDRKAPPLPWLLPLVEEDPDRRILRWLADLVGYEIKPKARGTVSEQLEALKLAVRSELGPGASAAVLRRAGVEP